MKILLSLLVIFSLISPGAYSQNIPELNHWFFGQFVQVDFSSGTPVASAGSAQASEGSAAISDETGALLFYTNGGTIWNAQHLVMLNGDGMKGGPSSTQTALIIQKPCDKTHYYIFTTAEEGGSDGLHYSEVDMTLDGGLGGVIPGMKNIQLYTPITEKLTVIKHADNKSLWLIAHKSSTNVYLAYHVTENGVNPVPVESTTSAASDNAGVGYMKASPDGSRLVNIEAREPSSINLLTTNSLTGAITHEYNLISPEQSPYGAEFSPDGKLLYVTFWNNPKIYQYNITLSTEAQISASATLVGTSGSGSQLFVGGIQLGPNGKIYGVKPWQSFLMSIENPNVIGIGCNFVDDAVALPSQCEYGTPNFQISYLDYDCEDPPVVIPEPEVVEPIEIPNVITANGDGINDLFKIKGLKPGTASLVIQNRWGNPVFSSDAYMNDWNGTSLVEGTYFYVLETKGTAADRYSGFVEIRR